MPGLPPASEAVSPRETALQSVQALQQQAATAGKTLRQPPTEPDSCCGRSCNGCVWEGYFGAVDYWREEALLKLVNQT